MNVIKKTDPENKQTSNSILPANNANVTTLDNQGKFSTGQDRVSKDTLEVIDLGRGGIGKPFLREKVMQEVRY